MCQTISINQPTQHKFGDKMRKALINFTKIKDNELSELAKFLNKELKKLKK
ncbi:MAG: hypothetical protein GQ570_10015 [Helicobacteraceae bacterium]|nr:hypothetical protein [Helicobacteraceae bacterium]